MLNIIKQNKYDIPKCLEIINLIYDINNFFIENELDEIVDKSNVGINKCKNLIEIAIMQSNEKLANASFVASQLFNSYYKYSVYWKMLKKEEYKSSWIILQDAIDSLICVLRFLNDKSQFNLDKLDFHFKQLEKLYPYKVFGSTEIIFNKTKCSICGKDALDLECTHVPGFLYWGEMAYTIVEDLEFKAVAMVNNPMDKRCVFEIEEGSENEKERYKLLSFFKSNIDNPFMLFEINQSDKIFKNNKSKIGRNEICFCGSNLKYKYCCGKNLYSKGVHSEIKQLNIMTI